ncbi:regulator of nonsense transcripts 1 homolog [Xenia sp. Carnegie-2017]|uniref:regulator of nonsense transcripts 1 homolog n=1 Tax=Xenia sp. Carnegie-2017 TaxID=2897299 RepID=UPI001F04E7DB|nr:regulator of nonsense transcripts 1 homolog [Xenia sp. Carnegie-2017]
MRNGYSPADITVICPYNAQVNRMKGKFLLEANKPSEQYFTKLKEIKITTIDSFQGEENKVILLSLVRSNENQKIGFLSSGNRICVAISRAKCALYIFGNPSVYTLSEKWAKIIRLFENRKLISFKFPFKNELEQVTDRDPLCKWLIQKISHILK